MPIREKMFVAVDSGPYEGVEGYTVSDSDGFAVEVQVLNPANVGKGARVRSGDVIRVAPGHLSEIRNFRSNTERPVRQATIPVGRTVETDVVRIHRYRYSVQVTDLTNAGRRGKNVEIKHLYDLDYLERNDIAQMELESLLRDLKTAPTAKAAFNALELYHRMWKQEGFGVKLSESTEKGVRVTPAGFAPIKIQTKDIRLEAGYNDFVVKDVKDVYNETTCIPAIKGGKRDIKVFYRLVKDNESRIQRMTFHELVSLMRGEGIKFHQYCAMD